MVSGLGRIPFVDAHCHVYGISKERLRKIVEEIVIVGVAEDYETSRRIIELSQQLPNIVPMIGLHPWKVPSVAEEELRNILSLIDRARGLGEIGLDGKTRALDKQIRFFEEQLKVASEYDLPVNIHSRAAWQEIANLLLKYEIKTAIWHWYSGPTEFLKDFEAQGYFITINPSVIFQDKHLKVLERAPMSIILTESDGPYNYRGKYLTPAEIPSLVSFIARVKQTTAKRVKQRIWENFRKIFPDIRFESRKY